MFRREPPRIAAPRVTSAVPAALACASVTLIGVSRPPLGEADAEPDGVETVIDRKGPWHYELRPDAAADGCPPMCADPRHDPRMRP